MRKGCAAAADGVRSGAPDVQISVGFGGGMFFVHFREFPQESERRSLFRCVETLSAELNSHARRCR